MILNHRLKAQPNQPEIKIIKEYSQLPLVKCYPSKLMQAKLILVFKSGITNEMNNYRPIPLLPTISKVYGKAVNYTSQIPIWYSP